MSTCSTDPAGRNVTPDDYDGVDDALTSAMVNNTFRYTIGFVPAGAYRCVHL
jgi:hypothetical protein